MKRHCQHYDSVSMSVSLLPPSHGHTTADRAKTIKTTAIINESETDKLIRHLREENARLMEMIKNGQISFTAPVGMSDEGGWSVGQKY